jgi:hypothetical protein
VSEAEYQQALVSTILAKNTDKAAFVDADQPGVRIYKNNWIENAHRALAVAFPTVKALLGDDNFKTLSRFTCQQLPKTEYDWGEWGVPNGFVDCVAAFLSEQNATHLSYVVDCAKLDEHVFLCQRQQDPILDEASLAILSGDHAGQSKLVISPTTFIFQSSFPVKAVFDYVHENVGDIGTIQQALKSAQNTAENEERYFVVSRTNFKPVVEEVSKADYLLLDMAKKNATVEQLFERAHALNIEFANWLGQAIANLRVIGASNTL